MRYSRNFLRDYEFYLKNLRFEDLFAGVSIELPPDDPEGKSAKECFYIFESTGALKPCREVELFYRLARTKAGINFHIKQWAEGYNDCMQGIEEYLVAFVDPPKWVKESLSHQRQPYEA